MIREEELLEVGMVGKPHGIKGELSCRFSIGAFDIEEIGFVVLCMEGIFVPFFIEKIRPKTSETALLTIDGFDSDVTVKTLVNKDIYVLKKEFSEISAEEDCDRLPIDYFIGFKVRSIDGSELGEIVDVYDSPKAVLFFIKNEDGTYPAPAVDDFIVDIDDEGKVLEVDFPEGLFDW